jgi:hypothetical protein
MTPNITYLNILRKWVKDCHRAAEQLDFGDARHDAKEVWDLFYQLEAGGKSIDSFLPATSSFGNATPEGRLSHFFTLCLNELKSRYPNGEIVCIKRYKKGDTLPNGQPAVRNIFVRTIPVKSVPEFRSIVASKLGL